MNYSEKDVQNKILNYLKKLKKEGHPIYYERRQAGGFSYKKGLPDIYFIYNGLHFEVEVKSSIGHLSTTQETWRNLFIKNNIPYVIINDFNVFKKIMSIIINYDFPLNDINKLILKEMGEISNDK